VSCWRITSPLYRDIAEFPTVQEHLKKQGVRFSSDFALTFNQNTYFNAGKFIASIRTILLQYIDTFRGRAVITQEIAVLLMAHCSADVSDNVIRILTAARVRVITFAPHTTQVVQVLDLTHFGVLKPCPRYELPFDDDNATVKVITKQYHDFTQTMARPNVWGTFRGLALGFDELSSVTFPWISYRADDVLLGSVGSTSLSKST
jgi:hypothetical protein